MPSLRGVSSQSPFPTGSGAELQSFLRFEKTDFFALSSFFSVSIWFPGTFSKLLFYLFIDKLIGYSPQKCSFYFYFVCSQLCYLPSLYDSFFNDGYFEASWDNVL